MGECFELTFFFDKKEENNKQTKKKILETLGLKEGKNYILNSQFSLFSEREIVLFHEYKYDDVEFIHCQVCFDEFIIIKENVNERINQLLQVVDAVNSSTSDILFVTGMYELTYHYIEKISSIKDFDKNTLSKFPLLFFKVGYEYNFKPSIFFKNTSCVLNLNNGVQDIFSKVN